MPPESARPRRSAGIEAEVGEAPGGRRRRGATAARTATGARKGFRLPLTVSHPALIDAGGDARFRQLLYDLSVLAAHLDRARRVLAARVGLTPPQYNIVMVVAECQGETGVSVGMVAERLHVSTAFVAAETARLALRGMVLKNPNPEDGRGVLLRLTAEAERRIEELGPLLVQLNDGFFGGLGAREFRAVAAAASRLVADSARALSVLPGEPATDARLLELPRPRSPRGAGAG